MRAAGTTAGRWAEAMRRKSERTGLAPAIVLGAGYGGLATARSLGRRGLPVGMLDARPWEVGMHTRHARPLLMPDPEQAPEEWVRTLSELAAGLERKPVVMPTGDVHLRLLDAARPALEPACALAMPATETLALLLDKGRQYEAMAAAGALLPRGGVARSEDDARRLAAEIGFPCLAKPAVSGRWTAMGRAKACVIRHPEDAAAAWRAMTEAAMGCLLQERIEGGDDSLYGVFSYSAARSERHVQMTKRKLRQFPEGRGNGSQQISIDRPELAACALELLGRLRYRGFASIEYKEDPADGRLKLIEINPRAASGLQLAVNSGCDLPWIAYGDLTGAPPAPDLQRKTGVRFVNIAWETQRVRQRKEGWARRWLGLAAMLARSRSFGDWSWSDPLPFLAYLRRRSR